jgi:Cu/Ag efflux pump CusA
MMVLAGLIVAIGVVVDDASTSVESVLHRFRRPIHDDADRETPAVVVDAVVEARTPAVYATLVILVALVPLFFVGGAVSSFLPPMAFAFGIAVLVSMLVALTVAPAMAVLLLPRGSGARRESPILGRIRGRYQAALGSIVSRVRPSFLTGAVVTAGVVAIVALAAVPAAAGGSPIPSFHAREILIHWDGAAGTSHPEMARIVGQASRELRGIAGVQNVGAHVGRAILSDEVSNVNAGEIWLTMAGDADYDTTLAAIQETVDGYPGLGTAVVTYPQERVDSVLAESGDDVTVRVYGQELALLDQHAETVRAAIAGIDGISGATIRTSIDEPALEVVVDLEAAARFGVKAGDVRRAAATLLSGIEVGLLFEQQKVFEVVVWGKPELRASVASVAGLGIETPSGALIRLDDVADVRIAPTPTVITREGVMRIVDVGAQIEGRDVGAVLRDVNAAVAAIGFPLEYHAEVFSPAGVQADAQLRLLIVLIGAAILVLLLLQAAFGRWRLAAMVFLTLPAAMVGGLLAGLAGGDLVSLGTLGGVFTVLAISTRTGVALIDHFHKMERVQGEPFGPSLVMKGAQERLGPTLMTAFGTAVAVLPFIILGDVAGLEIARPMAIFVLGGLITSSLVTLFVLPTLYLHSGPRLVADTETLLSEPGAFEPTTA